MSVIAVIATALGQPADYTPTANVAKGDVIVVGPSIAVALNDIASGVAGKIQPYGIVSLPKSIAAGSGAALAFGTPAYWDATNQRATPDATVGARIGIVVKQNSADADTSVLVLMSPSSSGLTSALYGNFRNMIDGGDMTINPAQRGVVQSADIAATTTYGPDRFAFKGGASSAINWSINADTSVAGFSKSLKFQRKSANADTAAVNMVQVLETIDSVRAQGSTITLSFWAKRGTNYSGGNLTVQVESGQGTDQSATNLIAGSWTSQAHVINTTQALTTTMTRYTFTGTVPAACTQLGLIFQWTPTGTAGADDSISINGVQLEIGNGATPFEHRDAEVELALCQRYYVRFSEPANGVVISGAGMINGANVEQVTLPLPTTMRAAPTVTVSAGSLKFNIAGVATAVGGGFAAGATHTTTMITVVGTVTATAGQATALQGGGGAGFVDASADL